MSEAAVVMVLAGGADGGVIRIITIIIAAIVFEVR